MYHIKQFKEVEVKPAVRFGQPVVVGTRVAVADILALLEAGYRIDEIPKQYPQINLDQAKQAVRFAAQALGQEEILTFHS